jgi:nitroimidazol reductase NimA-like FMN-containing flavoprotein (pyridoxamine 5'-phosphate oxidase superfamily)
MHVKSPYYQALTEDECLEMLRRHSLGRLAIEVDGQPDIFPVNYAMDGDRIVFRSGPGTKLDHASLNRVAFEIDEFDEDHQSACSVVVKGTGREFSEAIDPRSENERQLALATWMPSDGMSWIRIVPHEISGRQILSS